MRAFGQIPPAEIGRAIDLAGARARAAMMHYPRLHLVQAPRPRVGPWSHRPSVLTFAIRGSEGFFSAAALRAIYLAMARDASPELSTGASAADLKLAALPCRLGQPVQLGGVAIGGLRIAFSAAQISGSDDVCADLLAVFGKLATLLAKDTSASTV
jgi:hypothetical protein